MANGTRVCVLSECALSFRHGTGAQMIRLFDWSDPEMFHVYLTFFYGGLSEVGRSFRVEDPRWRGRGRRIARFVERAMGLNWWHGDEIRERPFRAWLSRQRLGADAAYVILAHEDHAKKMVSLLRVLGCPYIVHVMDIYHEEGLTPAQMPGFRALLAGASAVFAISDPIADELAKFDGPRARVLPIGHEVSASLARPPGDREPFRMVTVGKPYAEGIALLDAAWERLWSIFPDLEIHYSGQHKLEFPEHIRRRLRGTEYLSRADYEALLTRCQVAFLSGPLHLDRFGKFSIPSRIADYLMSGLPVLACVGQGTAMQRFLSPLVPDVVRFTRTPDELVAGMAAFRDPGSWQRAQTAARAFAVSTLDIVKIRVTVQAAIAAARNRPEPSRPSGDDVSRAF